ncbi:MAG: FMN-binding protein [Caldilineaceae bacterium]
MSQPRSRRTSGFVRTLKKFFVSGFLIVTFAAYALHERTVNPNTDSAAVVRSQPVAAAQQPLVAAQVAPTVTSTESPTAQPTVPPTATTGQLVLAPTATATELPPTDTPEPSPTPTAEIAGLYKDGTYTGPETNAFYGTVQVEAIIQNGKITDVEFLDYPQDRRTSARINSWAVPALQSEAIQAQSASVDIVSGATLTSRAFIQSLQAALDAAKA